MKIMIIPEIIITFDAAAGNAGECRIHSPKLGLGSPKHRRFPETARHISLRVEIHYYQLATIIGQIGKGLTVPALAVSNAKALCQLARVHKALSIVNAMTSRGGIPVSVDAWGAGAVYGSIASNA